MRKIILILLLFLHMTTQGQTIEQTISHIRNAVFTVYAEDNNGKPFASGSGFFISSEGIGVTNFHVLEGASSGHIKDANGRIYRIKNIIDYNPKYDLIKFRIEKKQNIRVLSLSLATIPPKQGQSIISFSNPLGEFENTASTGIVSSLRHMKDYENVIQITAPISHGSSGSPVLNLNGKVIGIATFGYEQGQSLNFAVNITQLKKMNRSLSIPIGDMRRNPFDTKEIRLASLLLNNQQYADAISLLDNEIKKSSKNSYAYFLRGIAKGRIANNAPYESFAGLYNDCLTDFVTACHIDSQKSIYFTKGGVFGTNMILRKININDTTNINKEEIAYIGSYFLQHAIDLDEQNAEAYSALANLIYQIYRLENEPRFLAVALKNISKAISIFPTSFDYALSAQIRMKLEDNGGALIDCDNCIALDPTFYSGYYTKGQIRALKLDQISDGLLDIEKALSLAPNIEIKADIIAVKGYIYRTASSKYVGGSTDNIEMLKKSYECYKQAYELTGIPDYQNCANDIVNIKNYILDHTR